MIKETSEDGYNEVSIFETLGAAGEGVWDDFRMPATTINPPGMISDPDVEATTGLLLFDQNSTEIVFVLMQMPHTWKEESFVTPHVHWHKTTSAAGDVLWRCRYKMTPFGEIMDTDWTILGDVTTPVAETPDIDTADYHMISVFGNLDMTGRRISDCILFEISRIGGDGTDTYGADARLLEFDVHYQKDAAGSVETFTKQTRPFID